MSHRHKSFEQRIARMFESLAVLGTLVLLGGRITGSVPIPGSEGNTTSPMNDRNHENNDIESTDQMIRKVLIEIIDRKFRDDDSHLIALIERGIVEAARSWPDASIEAGAKKAQGYVTDVTAAYTQAIFRAGSAREAEEILIRFQDTIQRIVEFAKDGDYAS